MLFNSAITTAALALVAAVSPAAASGHRHLHGVRDAGHAHALDSKASPTTLLTHVARQPTAVPAVSARGGGGGKRGIAYNDPSAATKVLSAAGGNAGKFAYAYNWDSNSNGFQSSLSYVPMLWAPIDVHLSRWSANAESSLAAGSTHMLSFNECDNAGQCNMGAEAAAQAHVAHMNPYAGRAKIGSPACTNSNLPGEGLDWMRAFMAKCDEINCAIDFCVTHWYHLPSAADDLFAHIQKVSDICGGRKVWVTEFAPVEASEQDINNFLPNVLPRLDADDNVEAYFYFMAGANSLLDSANSALSSYGSIYATN